MLAAGHDQRLDLARDSFATARSKSSLPGQRRDLGLVGEQDVDPAVVEQLREVGAVALDDRSCRTR